MYLKLFCVILLTLFIPLVSASVDNVFLDYTDTYNSYSHTMENNTLLLNLSADNSFDNVEIRQINPFAVGTYYHNISFYSLDHEYLITNRYDITGLLIYTVIHNCSVYNDGILRNSQIKEYKALSLTASVFRSKMHFGSFSADYPDRIYNEFFVSTWKGIESYFMYVSEIPQTDQENIRSMRLTKSSAFSTISTVTSYKLTGTYSEEYYIEQLSGPLEFFYRFGFKYLDADKSILNVMLITGYIFDILMFWIIVIAQSFFILLFLFMILIIPMCAYWNSSTQKGFIDTLVTYYSRFFWGLITILKYIIDIGIALLKLIPGL